MMTMKKEEIMETLEAIYTDFIRIFTMGFITKHN
jgi:hypothetical protein